MSGCQKDHIEKFLLSCSAMDFGPIALSGGEKEFCDELNQEVIALCRSLPESTQADALFLLMKCFHIPLGHELSFFMNYYAPAWSIIFWLLRSVPGGNALPPEDIRDAKTAHSMALLLHPIDDHLNDKELPATHLTLLVRSQLWMVMNNALCRLVNGEAQGAKIADGFLNDYYASMTGLEEVPSLDRYCDRFKSQMAIGYIVPGLIMRKMNADDRLVSAVQSAYASFGVAWRLLDDIKDIDADMMKNSRSAVYYCLADEVKRFWDNGAADRKSSARKMILEHILGNRIVEDLQKRMYEELSSAAAVLRDWHLGGLADELCALSIPQRSMGTAS